MTSICVQNLLLQLDLEMFQALIRFMNAILMIACNKSESCENLKTSNKQLRNKLSEISNERQRNGTSKSSKYRHLHKIQHSIDNNARLCTQDSENFTNDWITMKYNSDNQIFTNHNKISTYFRHEFEKRQNKLWSDYKRDRQKIINETLNAINTRTSLRQLQSNRIAVSLLGV